MLLGSFTLFACVALPSNNGASRVSTVDVCIEGSVFEAVFNVVNVFAFELVDVRVSLIAVSVTLFITSEVFAVFVVRVVREVTALDVHVVNVFVAVMTIVPVVPVVGSVVVVLFDVAS